MKQKKILITVIAVSFILLVAIGIWYAMSAQKNKNISTYDECVAAGHPVRESFPEQCAIPGGKIFTRTVPKGSSVSLDGRTICLLHKNMDGPHTMECAIGLKTDDGKYYGLGSDPYDSTLSVTDRRIHVEGIFKADPDSQYQSEGTISVSSYEFLN